MGITNNIPPSRLIQPGVIDNTAARPASPFEGQCIFQKDTDQLLVWNGTSWVIPNSPAQNPDGLSLITTTTCTSGGTASGGIVTIGSAVSSVVVDTAFSAIYDNYLITISGGAGTASSDINMNLGSKVANYWGQLTYSGWNNTPSAYGSKTWVTWYYAGYATTTGLSGKIYLNNPYLAKETSMESYQTGQDVAGHFVGRTNDVTQYTSFTLAFPGGAVNGGTIAVYGYRK